MAATAFDPKCTFAASAPIECSSSSHPGALAAFEYRWGFNMAKDGGLPRIVQ